MIISNLQTGKNKYEKLSPEQAYFCDRGNSFPFQYQYVFNKQTGTPIRAYFQSSHATGKIITNNTGYPKSIFLAYNLDGQENYVSGDIKDRELTNIQRTDDKNSNLDTDLLTSHLMAYISASAKTIDEVMIRYKAPFN